MRQTVAATLTYACIATACILPSAAASVRDGDDAVPGKAGGSTFGRSLAEHASVKTPPPPAKNKVQTTTTLHTSNKDLIPQLPIWADYFDDYTGTNVPPNPDNWTPDLGNGNNGWGNEELEYYISSAVSVYNGALQLVATQAANGTYYSGKVYSGGKRFFAPTASNGISVQASIQMPAGGIGMWPAFWMLPQNWTYGGWPASGEIDILEAVNNLKTCYGSLHYGTSWNDELSVQRSTWNPTEGYHIYAIEWTTTEMSFSLDGVVYSTVKCACAGNTTGNCGLTDGWYSTYPGAGPCAPFDQPFYINLNLAVGGDWPGTPTPNTSFPQTMYVDWVKVVPI